MEGGLILLEAQYLLVLVEKASRRLPKPGGIADV